MMKKSAMAWLILLLTVGVLAACGTESDSLPEDPDSGGDEVIEDEVTSTLEEIDNETYRYTVRNDTEEAVVFNFTSGQRYDFTLTDEEGNEVFRLSSVSMYTQALGEETLNSGEELQYDFQIPEANLEPGTYTLEVWLTPTEGMNYPAQIEHTID